VIVIDASAAIELILRTPSGRRVETRIFDRGEDVSAPHLIDVEVAHVLRRLAATGTDAAFCQAALGDWLAFGAVRYPHGELIGRVWELRSNFSAYDGAYIALAETLQAPLITHDRKLAATGHLAQVEVF
jgi:predicted nucleic acid-binding protein